MQKTSAVLHISQPPDLILTTDDEFPISIASYSLWHPSQHRLVSMLSNKLIRSSKKLPKQILELIIPHINQQFHAMNETESLIQSMNFAICLTNLNVKDSIDSTTFSKIPFLLLIAYTVSLSKIKHDKFDLDAYRTISKLVIEIAISNNSLIMNVFDKLCSINSRSQHADKFVLCFIKELSRIKPTKCVIWMYACLTRFLSVNGNGILKHPILLFKLLIIPFLKNFFLLDMIFALKCVSKMQFHVTSDIILHCLLLIECLLESNTTLSLKLNEKSSKLLARMVATKDSRLIKTLFLPILECFCFESNHKYLKNVFNFHIGPGINDREFKHSFKEQSNSYLEEKKNIVDKCLDIIHTWLISLLNSETHLAQFACLVLPTTKHKIDESRRHLIQTIEKGSLRKRLAIGCALASIDINDGVIYAIHDSSCFLIKDATKYDYFFLRQLSSPFNGLRIEIQKHFFSK